MHVVILPALELTARLPAASVYVLPTRTQVTFVTTPIQKPADIRNTNHVMLLGFWKQFAIQGVFERKHRARIYLSIYLLSVCLSVYPPTNQPTNLLPTYQPPHLPT
jgi:hypothetical protein